MGSIELDIGTNDEPDFGAYRPSPAASAILAVCHFLSRTPVLSTRRCFRLPLALVSDGPFDVTTLGVRMRSHPWDNLSDSKLLLTPRHYCPKEIRILKQALAQGGVFVDIGANIGAFTLQAAQFERVQVLAIEPNPVAAQRLRTNLAVNGFASAFIVETAIGRSTGEALFTRTSRMTAERTPVERADHTGIVGRTGPRHGLDRGYPVGDGKKRPLFVNSHSRICLEFHGARHPSDGGFLAYRELDERPGLTGMAKDWLVDTRPGLNKRHSLIGLLRHSVYARLARYEDLNDAERLRVDPVFGKLIGGRATDKVAASVSPMSRFETEMLTARGNLHGLEALNREWVEQADTFTPKRPVILDLDSSESPTYGAQEGSAYNGHFTKTCCHSLSCFNYLGDFEGAMLREGNVASALEWRAVLEPVQDSYRSQNMPVYFRADAAFAMPEVYEYLEDNEVLYAIRIKANAVLERRIEQLLRRRVGRPSNKPEVFYASFPYQAKSWDRSRRVVAKEEWHVGELFPRVGFIVTNLTRHTHNVVRSYNGRGTAEQWIKEGKCALKWTRLSCRRFLDNAVRLQLFALAYNLTNFLRRMVLYRSRLSMTRNQTRAGCTDRYFSARVAAHALV